MKRTSLIALFTTLLLLPTAASASFYQSAKQAQTQVNTLSQQQLDSLNARVFSDAFIAAKIVGFDRNEIDQLKADMQALKAENAQLRAQLTSRPAAVSGALTDDSRISALETKFSSLQETLATVVQLLTIVLAKIQ